MNITKKLEYAIRDIKNIGSHDDEDSAVRLAALDAIEKAAGAEKTAVLERVAVEVAAAVK